LLKIIKISPYLSKIQLAKVGAFFSETECIALLYIYPTTLSCQLLSKTVVERQNIHTYTHTTDFSFTSSYFQGNNALNWVPTGKSVGTARARFLQARCPSSCTTNTLKTSKVYWLLLLLLLLLLFLLARL